MKLFKKHRRVGKGLTFARPLNVMSTESTAEDISAAYIVAVFSAAAFTFWAYSAVNSLLSILVGSVTVAFTILASHPDSRIGGKRSHAVGYHYFGELRGLESSLRILRSKFLKYGDPDSDDAALLKAALSLFNQTVLKAEKSNRDLRKSYEHYVAHLPAIKKSRKASLDRKSVV